MHALTSRLTALAFSARRKTTLGLSPWKWEERFGFKGHLYPKSSPERIFPENVMVCSCVLALPVNQTRVRCRENVVEVRVVTGAAWSDSFFSSWAFDGATGMARLLGLIYGIAVLG